MALHQIVKSQLMKSQFIKSSLVISKKGQQLDKLVVIILASYAKGMERSYIGLDGASK